MYIHLGRDVIVDESEILLILDFDEMTSDIKGRKTIDYLISKYDLNIPKDHIMPQSVVFVSYENDIDEEYLKEINQRKENKERFLKTLEAERKTEVSEEEFIDDERFLPGGEFYLDEPIVYSRIRGRIPNIEELMAKLTEEELPFLYYLFFYEYSDKRIKFEFKNTFNKKDEFILLSNEEYFFNFGIRKIKKLLPEYSIFEKWKFLIAYISLLYKELGLEKCLESVNEAGLEEALAFGRLYIYGEKVYYDNPTRLSVFVSEHSCNTLIKRIEEGKAYLTDESLQNYI